MVGKWCILEKEKKQKKSLRLLSGFLSSLAITLQYISFSPMLLSILCLNPIVTDYFSLQIYSSVPVVSMRNLRLGTVAMVLATGFWKRMNPVEKYFRAQVPCDKITYLVSQMRSTVRTLFFTHCKNWYPEPGAKIVKNGASLMVQWLRIHLTMLGTLVWYLVWEDPKCRGATKPACHKWWSPRLEPVLCNRRSHRNEKLVHCKKNRPHSLQLKKGRAQQQKPNVAKKETDI